MIKWEDDQCCQLAFLLLLYFVPKSKKMLESVIGTVKDCKSGGSRGLSTEVAA